MPALLLDCLRRCRTGFPRASEGRIGSACPSDPVAPGGNTGHRHQHRPSYSWSTDPDMAFGSSSDQGDVLAPGGNTGHTDQGGSGGSVAPRQHQGFRLLSQPRASVQPLVAIQDSDFSTDRSCGRTMNRPGRGLWQQLGLDVTIAPGGSAGYSD